MVISRIYGGMGNQMFQYAFGRAIAEKLNTELQLDIRMLESYATRPNITTRVFDLDLYNISAKLSNDDIIKTLPIYSTRSDRYKRIVKNILGIKTFYNNFELITQSRFNPKNISIGNNYLLEGYWQKYEYFKDIEKIIRAEFKLKDKPSDKIIEIENYIEGRNAVAIQIRKTDYLSITSNRIMFAELKQDYFEAAYNLIKSKVEKPLFLIFSDDNEWARQNLQFIKDEMLIIEEEWKGDKFQYSTYLMNKCKNHIISNSSFGWWGAFLADNPEQIVIAPQKWYNIPHKNLNISTPPAWIRI
ncbi:MAG TPA: alpha-1,2-fucosyltransferase [Candidatus Kapabacteria bacterium]|nr:alpha-1,2-fucosyltransferase [Candidatus Kapabacteria bacterium]